VHVAADSALVAAGDRVAAGQPICASGAAGFCPEPHLHLEFHLSDERDAPSCRFRLRGAGGVVKYPEVGEEWWPPEDGEKDTDGEG